MNFKEIFNFENVGLLNSIALILFLGVFILVTLRVIMQSSKDMKDASQLPLDEAPNYKQTHQEQIP